MVKMIKISDELYDRLASIANGFDTPEDVIQRALNENAGIDTPKLTGSSKSIYSKKDTTKYEFNGGVYGKGRLVLAVIKDYVANNPRVSINGLIEAFPRRLQGVLQVVDEINVARAKTKNVKRHFFNDEDVLQVGNSKAVVCTQWGIRNIDNFVTHAEELGYQISRV